jgi:hypothetical protein
MKKVLILITLLSLSINIYSQVIVDKVYLTVGDEVMEAEKPTTMEGMEKMLANVVNMYNKLNTSYMEMQSLVEEYTRETSIVTGEVTETVSQLEANQKRLNTAIDNAIAFGREVEHDSFKFGFLIGYSYLTNIYHSANLNFAVSKSGYLIGGGPLVFINTIRNAENFKLGFNLNFGILF